jgi:SAM-dependent methyltransferase
MSEWWENFFHGVALDFWRAVITSEQTCAEADFIQQHLAVTPGAKILDVPCGNGRIALELASRGFQISGIDIAEEFIAEAKANSDARALSIEWVRGDMRHLPWLETFDGAFCFGNSFGYLSDEANADFVISVGRSLRPRGRFIIDSGAIAECILPALQEEGSFEIGGIKLESKRRYDHEQGRMFVEYSFTRDGKTDKRLSSQRIYTYHELAGLLGRAGVRIISAYSSLAGEPFKLGSNRLLLVAVKS